MPDAQDRPALDAKALEEITRVTLSHYERGAEGFWEGTRDHDVSQNIEALLDALEGRGPHRIRDGGGGPGRDLAERRRRGHDPLGLDGAAAFCAMARAHAGCEVWRQDFLALSLPPARFDGVFANASLFHVPAQALPRVLRALHAALVPGGALFSSNPRGGNVEGWSGDRYGSYHDLAGWARHMETAGFAAIGHYYRPPGRPRAQQPWLASTWRRRP